MQKGIEAWFPSVLTLLRKRSRTAGTRPRWTPSGLIMTNVVCKNIKLVRFQAIATMEDMWYAIKNGDLGTISRQRSTSPCQRSSPPLSLVRERLISLYAYWSVYNSWWRMLICLFSANMHPLNRHRQAALQEFSWIRSKALIWCRILYEPARYRRYKNTREMIAWSDRPLIERYCSANQQHNLTWTRMDIPRLDLHSQGAEAVS